MAEMKNTLNEINSRLDEAKKSSAKLKNYYMKLFKIKHRKKKLEEK